MCSIDYDYDSNSSNEEECMAYKVLYNQKENYVEVMESLLDQLYSDKEIDIAKLEDALDNLAHYFELKIRNTPLKIVRTKDTVTSLTQFVTELNLARAI